MTDVEKRKNLILIRSDYLAKLPSNPSARDASIQMAISCFLQLSTPEQQEAISKQRVHISWPAGMKPEYTMEVQDITVPDDRIEQLQESVQYSDLDRILNTAIKLWLRKQNPGTVITD